jgi:hypothetical protein
MFPIAVDNTLSNPFSAVTYAILTPEQYITVVETRRVRLLVPCAVLYAVRPVFTAVTVLPPHNKASFTFPTTFHFHLLFYYISYLSLSQRPIQLPQAVTLLPCIQRTRLQTTARTPKSLTDRSTCNAPDLHSGGVHFEPRLGP